MNICINVYQIHCNINHPQDSPLTTHYFRLKYVCTLCLTLLTHLVCGNGLCMCKLKKKNHNMQALEARIPVYCLRNLLDSIADQCVTRLKSEVVVSKAQTALLPSCYAFHFLLQVTHG